MGWFRKFGSSNWWFGENSFYGQALRTASDSGLEFGDFKFSPQANVGMSNDKLVNYALVGGLMILLFRK